MNRAKSRPGPGWVGIDVSKDTFDVAIWGDQDFQSMSLTQFRRTKKGTGDFIRWLSAQARRAAGIVMEWTGGYSRELAEWINAAVPNQPVSLINPCQAKSFGKSFNVRNKTDAVDARLLALYGEERQPSRWIPPTPAQDQLQSIFRTRAKLIEMSTALRTREESCLKMAMAAEKAQAEVIETLQAKIKALDRAAEEVAAQNPAMAADMALLQTIPGVGPVTAMAMLAEVGDPRRFRRGRQLAAFLGVSPKRYESGSSVHGRTRMCRVGGTHIRPVLYMAAVSITSKKGPLGDFYRRLVEVGRPEMVAIGAVMRKLVLVMRSVLVRNKPFQVISPPSKPMAQRPARPEGRSKGPGGCPGPARDWDSRQDGQAIARQGNVVPSLLQPEIVANP